MAEVSKVETAFINFRNWLRSLFRRKQDPLETPEVWFKDAKLRRPAPPAPIPQSLSYRALMQRCAECNKKAFWFQGPQGGMSLNIFCGHCGQGYNVSPPLEYVEKISKDAKYIQKGGMPDASRRR